MIPAPFYGNRTFEQFDVISRIDRLFRAIEQPTPEKPNTKECSYAPLSAIYGSQLSLAATGIYQDPLSGKQTLNRGYVMVNKHDAEQPHQVVDREHKGTHRLTRSAVIKHFP